MVAKISHNYVEIRVDFISHLQHKKILRSDSLRFLRLQKRWVVGEEKTILAFDEVFKDSFDLAFFNLQLFEKAVFNFLMQLGELSENKVYDFRAVFFNDVLAFLEQR